VILLSDNFSGDPLGPVLPSSGWLVDVDTWTVVNDPGHVLKGTRPSTTEWATIHSTAVGSSDWKDYKITAKIKADSTSEVKITARWQDNGNFYACGLDSGNMAFGGKRLGGVWYDGDYKTFDHSFNRFYDITFQLVGDNFTCTITDPVSSTSVTLNWSYPYFANGTVGVAAQGTGEITNVVVTKIG
jgi:hypothetical protein